LASFLRLCDDEEIQRVFDKYSGHGSLSAQRLKAALEDLGASANMPLETLEVSLDDFKRIARQPSEAELWIQMMLPMAGLLAHCLGQRDLDGLQHLGKGEIQAGLQLFYQGVEAMAGKGLGKLKEQKEKLQAVNGNSKFGDVLEGGTVEDFHRGLADRLGKPPLA